MALGAQLGGSLTAGTLNTVCPVYHIQQHKVVHTVVRVRILRAGNGDFILQRQIAVIDNAQLRQLIGRTRLPQDVVCAIVSRSEIEDFTLGLIPRSRCTGFGIPSSRILEFDIQIAGLDLVYRSRCGVGEPCICGADEH